MNPPVEFIHPRTGDRLLPGIRGVLSSVRAFFSNPFVRCSAYGLAALWCFLRVATFVPQPLDSVHTLRPILNRWLAGFVRLYDQPETAYSNWRTLCFVLLSIPPILAILSYLRERGTIYFPKEVAKVVYSKTLFFGTIALSIFICRFPTLLDFQLNPDEAEFLSAAHKLFYDLDFFRSTDTGTSGPVNIYPLMLPAIFGLSPDFASSRVIVLIIVFLNVYLLYRSTALLTSDAVARVAILPAAAAFAIFERSNLIHYSSEHTPLLLISIALYCGVKVLRNPASYRRRLLILGLLASLGFFSKMQSVPVISAIAFVVILYLQVTHKGRNFWMTSSLFLAGVLPLLMLNAVLCLRTGVWNNFLVSYIVSNQRYTELDSSFFRDLPAFLSYVIETLEIRFFLFSFFSLIFVYAWQRRSTYSGDEASVVARWVGVAGIAVTAGMAVAPSNPSGIYIYWSLLLLFAIPTYLFLRTRKSAISRDPVSWFGFLSLVLIAAALFSIQKPHRLFPHYLLFLITPVSVAMAWMLIRQTRLVDGQEGSDKSNHAPMPIASAFLFVYVILTLTYSSYVWQAQTVQNFRNIVPTIRPPEGNLIRSLTSPKGRIYVWGWTADPFLGSGRVSATRDLNLFYFYGAPPEIRAYYRARFLHDMKENPAELFINAIGPKSWSMTDSKIYNFEQYPEIAKYVHSNYVHLADIYDEEFFLRRDLAATRGATQFDICTVQAISCTNEPAHIYSIEALVLSAVKVLPAIKVPAHARIEARFTPMARQTASATVFNNEAAPGSHRGFRFQTIGGDRYRLLLGVGDHWMLSKSIYLPPAKSAFVTIDFDEKNVYLRCNGVAFDDMHLPSRMADAPGQVTVGSWIGGLCRFTGNIDSFRVLNLGTSK